MPLVRLLLITAMVSPAGRTISSSTVRGYFHNSVLFLLLHKRHRLPSDVHRSARARQTARE